MNIEEYRRLYSSEDSAPGWESIDKAVKGVYPNQEPRHIAAVPHYAVGGKDPIDGVSLYQASYEGQDYTHLVTYGFSSLYYDEESVGADHSRWGFELTMRVVPYSDDIDDPLWAVAVMQNLARYVFGSKKWFEPGHYIPANGPIRTDVDTALVGLTFDLDPELGTIDTPHGQVQFLQMFGITESELAVLSEGGTVQEVLAEHRPQNPLLLTDLNRTDV